MKRALLFFALAMVLCAAGAYAQESPSAWLEAARRAAGARQVTPDRLLALAAERWAAVLAKAGTMSHRGADGTGPLDRFRAAGGTDVHVGEILGAGPTLADVEKGWMHSSTHRALALAPSWTHVGWGMSRKGGSQVWVVLFCERLVNGLSLERGADGLRVSGSLAAGGAPLLYSGLAPVQPSSWDPASRSFTFLVPDEQLADYLRLGFITAAGAFQLTNAFTLPPGMAPPAGSSRSSASGASP